MVSEKEEIKRNNTIKKRANVINFNEKKTSKTKTSKNIIEIGQKFLIINTEY